MSFTPKDRAAVFTSARNGYKAFRTMVDAVIACDLDWTGDAALIADIGDAHKHGIACCILNLKDEAAALVVFGKKPFDAKLATVDVATTRTKDEQLACQAASQSWSKVCALAGKPSRKASGAGKVKGAKDGKDSGGAKTELPENLMPAIVRAMSPADVHGYMLRVAQNVTKYLNLNAEFIKGESGSLLTTLPLKIRKSVKADQGVLKDVVAIVEGERAAA